jgi:hypothetical protein
MCGKYFNKNAVEKHKTQCHHVNCYLSMENHALANHEFVSPSYETMSGQYKVPKSKTATHVPRPTLPSGPRQTHSEHFEQYLSDDEFLNLMDIDKW